MNYFRDSLRASLVRNCLAIDPSGPHLVVVDASPHLPPPGTILHPGPFYRGRHPLLEVPLNLSLEECVWYLTNPVGVPGGPVWSDFDESLQTLLVKPTTLHTSVHPKVVEACEDPVYNSWLDEIENRRPTMADSNLKDLPKRFAFLPKFSCVLDLETNQPIGRREWKSTFESTIGLTFEDLVGVLELAPRPSGRRRCNLPKEAR